MNLTFTPEQDELRQLVRRVLRDTSPQDEVRRLMESELGFDPDVWSLLTAELGLGALAVPEEFGGAGCGPVEIGIVMEEAGASLLCAPYFSSVVLATTALLHSDDEPVQRELLPDLAGGRVRATIAWVEDTGRWDEAGVTLQAARTADGWTLTGHKCFVLDGHSADRIVVAARTASGVSLFLVDGDDRGLTRTPLPTMDLTRRQARLTFDQVPARLVGAEGSGWPVLAKTLDVAAIALAAEQVGGAQRVLDMAVDFAKVRTQFGRPIGSFQAIKHKCADMLLRVETARSAAYYALAAAAAADPDLPQLAAIAKAYCSDAYFAVAAENIQVHGGIGFTWEHPAQLHFKRAKTSQSYLGDALYHRSALARTLGI